MDRRRFLKSIGKVIGGLVVVLGVVKATGDKLTPKAIECINHPVHVWWEKEDGCFVRDAEPKQEYFEGIPMPPPYCDQDEYERLRQEVVEMFRPKGQMYYRLPDGRIVGDGWDADAVQWGKMT